MSDARPLAAISPAAVLDAFRAEDNRAPSLAVAADPVAMRMLAVWSPAVVRRAEPPEGDCPNGDAAWDWLWSGVEIDVDEIADRAGMTPSHAEARLSQLVASRLVYPDGTISDWGRSLANTAIAREFKIGRPKPAPKPEKFEGG